MSKPPIKRVQDVKHKNSWAIYGRSGSGKTTFSGSFPQPILLLDIKDQGTKSVADIEDLDVWQINDWDEFEDAYWFLKTSKQHDYKTVVIDTITQCQQLCIIDVLTGKKKKTDRAGDWGTMSKRDWGDASAMLKEKVTSFRDLPMEVVFLAQERTTIDEESEDNPDSVLIPEVGPAIMKSVASHLNASVSIIGHTFIREQIVRKKLNGKIKEKHEIRYCLRIGPNPIYTTKVRKPKSIIVPLYVEDPTYEDIIDAIEGKD